MAGTLRYLDKVVIVTGGSKGIGKGIVRVFVENGAKVVFCARGVEAGRCLETELNRAGPGSCLFLPGDMTKEADIKKLISVTAERFGRIDCLVNNAGWHPPHRSIDETTAEEFRDLLNFNLISYFLTTKARHRDYALPHLRQCQGNIINISSNVMTPLWEELASQTGDAAATIKAGEEAQLIGRMGTEAECGLAALFLAADASFCTGVDLLLSGGAELNYGRKSQIS
ncbi:hypothetical protein JZ751_015043 [Albula glossodonta]|uniref:17-beta-hydroxysteroid dehydrogenase 14 n=1 Tax=Albula glossodonta TaxID=121402 RepID=A0A8T2NTG9_9TELE|nr:hypothetical protein JZ751_015043 [Albula glossodonta]